MSNTPDCYIALIHVEHERQNRLSSVPTMVAGSPCPQFLIRPWLASRSLFAVGEGRLCLMWGGRREKTELTNRKRKMPVLRFPFHYDFFLFQLFCFIS